MPFNTIGLAFQDQQALLTTASESAPRQPVIDVTSDVTIWRNVSSRGITGAHSPRFFLTSWYDPGDFKD